MSYWGALSNYEQLSIIVSSIGFLLIFGTLIALIIQTRYNSKALYCSIFESIANQMFSVDNVFIQQPEIRDYFYNRKSIEIDDPNHSKVVAIAEYKLDFFGSLILHRKNFKHMWPKSWWDNYIIDSFSNSPILCDYLELRKNWYTNDLYSYMLKGKQKRMKLEK